MLAANPTVLLRSYSESCFQLVSLMAAEAVALIEGSMLVLAAVTLDFAAFWTLSCARNSGRFAKASFMSCSTSSFSMEVTD